MPVSCCVGVGVILSDRRRPTLREAVRPDDCLAAYHTRDGVEARSSARPRHLRRCLGRRGQRHARVRRLCLRVGDWRQLRGNARRRPTAFQPHCTRARRLYPHARRAAGGCGVRLLSHWRRGIDSVGDGRRGVPVRGVLVHTARPIRVVDGRLGMELRAALRVAERRDGSRCPLLDWTKLVPSEGRGGRVRVAGRGWQGEGQPRSAVFG